MRSNDAKPYRWPYEMRRIVDNLVVAGNEVWAVYVVPRSSWRWRADGDRLESVNAEARVWSALAEKGPRYVRRRTTARPYPVGEWARTLVELSPDALTGTPSPNFNDDLVAQQRWMLNGGTGERAVYAAVQLLSGRPRQGAALARSATLRRSAAVNVESLDDEISWVDQVMAGNGYGARPASIPEMEWLLHRSIGLGLATPEDLLSPWGDEQGEWEADDLYALIEGLTVTPCPSGQAVKYAVTRASGPAEAYVSTVTLGRMAPMQIPDPRGTWLSVADRLGVAFEAVDTVLLLPGTAVAGTITKHLRKIRSQESDYRLQGMDPPESLPRTAAHARRAQDETSYGDEVTSTRVEGWYRVALSGRSEKEAVDRANTLIRTYQTRRISAHLTPAQVRVQREFVVGEPVGYTAHRRRMPVLMHAAGKPQSASGLGDKRGPAIGYLSGSARLPVCFDTHYSTMFKKGSGLFAIAGRQGAGKSALGLEIFYSAIKRGIPGVYLDPSITAAGLMTLPELAGLLNHIDLARVGDGLLSPWFAVPDPRRADFTDHEEFQEEVAEAEQTRRDLASEVATLLLPRPVMKAEHSELLLMTAINHVGGARNGSYWSVIHYLRSAGLAEQLPTAEEKRAAQLLADNLDRVLATRRGRGFAPNKLSGVNAAQLDGTWLGTIITMGTPDLPKSEDSSTWTPQQRLVVAQLSVAAWLTARLAYGQERRRPKIIAADETQFLDMWASGRALFARLHRDTRKWNLCVLKMTQNPRDEIQQGVGNHLAGVFVGRIEDTEAAADALALLEAPLDSGYESVIKGLSAPLQNNQPPPYREFVYRDPDGNIDRMVVDFAWCPHLLAAIQTDVADQDQTTGEDEDEVGEEWDSPVALAPAKWKVTA